MSEAVWTAHVLQLAAALNWVTCHFRPARTDKGWRTAVQGMGVGFPDLVLVRPPRLVFADVQAGRGKRSPAQQVWLGLPSKVAGVETYVWRPSERGAVVALLS